MLRNECCKEKIANVTKKPTLNIKSCAETRIGLDIKSQSVFAHESLKMKMFLNILSLTEKLALNLV